jgi:hypothetical protein
MSNRRGIYRVLVGKPEGETLLAKAMLKWEDNIKMGLQEVGFNGMDWLRMGTVVRHL